MNTASSAWIIGIGQTDFGKFRDRPIESLGREAALAALNDSGLEPRQIQAVFTGSVFSGSLISQRIAKDIGFDGLPAFNHENACASGGTALHHAWTTVVAGMYDAVLVLGVEKLSSLGGGLLPIAPDDPEVAQGMTMPALYAMRTESYLSKFGGNAADVAEVTVKSRNHAANNPHAQYRKPTTIAEVLASKPLADPITLLQMCPNADGAAAVIVVSDRLAKSDRTNIEIKASVVTSGNFYQGERDLIWPDITLRAGEAAYAMAGVGPADIDVAEVHDAAAIAEVIYYEALGFCARGEGLEFVKTGKSSSAGSVAVNTGGGLLSRGHPLGATGIVQIVELVAQLRGTAGCNQVADAVTALAHCTGGGIWGVDNGACTVHVLKA